MLTILIGTPDQARISDRMTAQVMWPEMYYHQLAGFLHNRSVTLITNRGNPFLGFDFMGFDIIFESSGQPAFVG